MSVLNWLLNADPAICWQVLRDLFDEPAEVVADERARVANEGWGARLLALGDEDGQWAGGACFPSRSRYQWDQEPRATLDLYAADITALIRRTDPKTDPKRLQKVSRRHGRSKSVASGSSERSC